MTYRQLVSICQKGLNKMDQNLVAGVRRCARMTAKQLRTGSASGQLGFQPFSLFFFFSCFYTFTLSHFLDCFSSLLQQGNREGEMCGKAREKVQESEGGSQY